MKIKILHFVHRLQYADGIFNYVKRLCSNYDKDLYEITIVTFYDQNNIHIIKELNQQNVGVFQLKPTVFDKFKNQYLRLILKNIGVSYYLKYLQLKKIISKLEPTLVIAHGEDCELIGGLLSSKIFKINLLHSYVYFPKNYLYKFILNHISRKNFNETITVNKALVKVISLKNSAFVVPAGIDLQIFSPNSISRGNNNSNIVVGYIGRLSREKNVDKIINAFSLIANNNSNITLLIAGIGNYYPSLQRLVKNNMSNRIKFLGEISDTPGFYRMIDIFISASNFEGGPITLLEAIASNNVVVSTKVGLVPQLIEMGVKIILLKNSTTMIIKETLEHTIKNLNFY